MLLTDYLVVGAGAASMAFVDTLLAEQPNATVVIVDKHRQPGGHWNDAYGHVRLHQPSLLYGVSSFQLEGNWLELLLLRWRLPWHHRAGKAEILTYYNSVMCRWIFSGRVKYYPECIYDYEAGTADSAGDNSVYTFRSLDGKQTHCVKVKAKLVNGVLGECKVPSTTPPEFHVAPDVMMWTPNQVHDAFIQTPAASLTSRWLRWMPANAQSSKRFVVLGCGKTAMDTVIFLRKVAGIHADQITWVIPNDVWIICRDGLGSPWSWPVALLSADMNAHAAALELEKAQILVRIDPAVVNQISLPPSWG